MSWVSVSGDNLTCGTLVRGTTFTNSQKWIKDGYEKYNCITIGIVKHTSPNVYDIQVDKININYALQPEYEPKITYLVHNPGTSGSIIIEQFVGTNDEKDAEIYRLTH